MPDAIGRRDDTQQARERLTEWANGVTVSAQSHRPVYPNPGALKDDIRALVAERDRYETEAIERVAEALYERAMEERRTFSQEPQKFGKRWRDDPYVPPFDGTSRPTNWRDQWRDEARAALAGSEASE